MEDHKITSFTLEKERKGMSTGKLFHDVLSIVLSILNVYVYVQILIYASQIEELPLGQFIISIIGIIYIFASMETLRHNILKSINYV